MHYTVTSRCNTTKWGDYRGHKERGEDACPRCSYLASARRRVSQLRRGHGLALESRDLLGIISEFGKVWSQPHDGVTPSTALIVAVETVLINRAPLMEVEAAA